MPDLWSIDLGDAMQSLPVTPVMEQAKLLPSHTEGLVEAQVYSVQTDEGKLAYNFDLVVKRLKYRFTLLTLRYGFEGYPALLLPYSRICEEIFSPPFPNADLPSNVQVDDEPSLVKELGRILRSDTTRNILRTLMAEARMERHE